MYRHENQIAADLTNMLDNVLVASGLSDWQAVQQFQREQFSDMEKVVRFFSVSVNRLGWQGRKYIAPDGVLYRREFWREERRIQIDCLMSRKNTDTETTVTAVDVARLLQAYFNGLGGGAALEQYNFSRLLVENIRIPAELDDSSKFRLYPGFDLILLYDQDIDLPQDEIDDYRYGLHGI